MYNTRQTMKVKIPAGYPAWRGPDEEPTIAHWLENNYAKPSGVDSVTWLKANFPKHNSESDTEWLERLAQHPIWAHALLAWPEFPCEVENIRLGLGNRIYAKVQNHHAMQNYYELLDWFLEQRTKSLKAHGWIPQDTFESGVRFGKGYRAKNAVHALLRAMNVQSLLTLQLPGELFFHTNTVLPSNEARRVSGQSHDIYNPGSVGPWSLHSTHLFANHETGMAVTSSNLDQTTLTSTMTEWKHKPLKWQNYQAIIHGYMDPQGDVHFRGWVSPEKLVLMGAPKGATDSDLIPFGFERGYPHHFIRDGQRTVPCLGQREERVYEYKAIVRKKDVTERNGKLIEIMADVPVTKTRTALQYFMPFDQLNDPVSLLRKLEGFDESRIGPIR